MSNKYTFNDAARMVEGLDRLSIQRRRDLLSALSRVSSMLNRPLVDVPTDPARLRVMLGGIKAPLFGITAKTLSNILANVSAALIETGLMPPLEPQRPPTEAWSLFLGMTDVRFHAVVLSRFLAFCIARGIEPHDVSQGTLTDFEAYISDRLLRRGPHEIVRETAITWNMIAQRSSASFVELVVPRKPSYRCRPLSEYPSNLQADIRNYLGRLSHADLFDEDGPDTASRPTTLRNVEANLRQYLHALCETGISPAELRSLRCAITALNMRTAGRRIMDRRQSDKARSTVFNIFATCIAIARHELRLPDQDLTVMSNLKKKAASNREGLTDKNRDRLGQFHDFRNISALISLPDKLMQMATENPRAPTSPLRAMWAVAITLLLCCPMRIKNLAELDIDRNLRFTGGRGRLKLGAKIRVSIDGSYVKNGSPIDFDLNPKHSAVVHRYLYEFRSRLSDAPTTALFPRQSDGTPRPEASFGKGLSDEIMRYTGLAVNPHLFRHFAAYLYLRERPGEFETVRRLLKHKNLQTTVSFYAHLNNEWAHEHYHDVVLGKFGGSHDR